jgi:carboxyl-terminal processing protease
MRSLLDLVRLSVAIFALLMSFEPSASAQVRIPAQATSGTAALNEVFRQGSQLESTRQWNEAVTHYEQAVDRHPGYRELQNRLIVARTHLDLARRYADHSFLRSLRKMNSDEWLGVYSEVLAKIQSHYVNLSDWHSLVERGLTNVQVALTESKCREQHTLQVSFGDVVPVFDNVRRMLADRPVRSREQARNFASYAAQVFNRQVGFPESAVYAEFICAAASALDEYSAYLTGSQLDDVFSQIEGNFVGLGIEIKSQTDSLLVVRVIPGGPAAESGMLAGDRIVAVNGTRVRATTTDTAADMLKGVAGSEVSVAIQREARQPQALRIVRRRVEVPSIENTTIVDQQMGIGYLRLTSFQKTTSRDLDYALWELNKQGMRGLIIDLRGNPGGLLDAAVEVADKFLEAGTIVSTRGRGFQEDMDYQARLVGTWRVPLVVLLDRESASASEILAGAIRDQRRGTIVGERSYGKGSVQGIFPLHSMNGGIRLTTAKFYSPNGKAISGHGVQPHVRVQLVAKSYDVLAGVSKANDAAFSVALDVARKQQAK